MTIDLFVAHILLQTEWRNSLGYAEPIILRVTEKTHACELSSESHTTLLWSFRNALWSYLQALWASKTV